METEYDITVNLNKLVEIYNTLNTISVSGENVERLAYSKQTIMSFIKDKRDFKEISNITQNNQIDF